MSMWIKHSTFKPKSWIVRHKVFLSCVAFVLLLLTVVCYVFVAQPLLALKKDVYAIEQVGKELATAVKEKKYEAIITNIGTLEALQDQTERDYRKLRFVRYIPVATNYYTDGERMLTILQHGLNMANVSVVALEPHRVLLGFEGEQNLTTEQHLFQFAQIAPQLSPMLDSIYNEVHAIQEQLSKINIYKYPATIRGIALHTQYEKLTKETLPFVQQLTTQLSPVISEIPQALGSTEPARYLFLFQNDKEIRPTGGFITAYAIVSFDAGSLKIDDSGDIYDVDPERSILPMPRPIAQYLGVGTYYMRDTNFSPDFPTSMRDFEKYYPHTNLPEVKGIIALDTQFLSAMLEFLGPVDMAKYSLDFENQAHLPDSCRVGGTSFTAENVVCRLELYAQRILDRNNDRKQILGDLMDVIVEKIFMLESNQLPGFLSVVLKELDEKHVLLYLHNERLQTFADSFNWTGRILEAPQNTDYLHVNDANLAGRKSDMYLIRTVDQKVEIAEDGTVQKTVTLTYTNPKPQDNWLNNVARNYVRLYVPLGAELITTDGDLQQVPTVSEDLGKTVFDTFVAIPPLEQRTVRFTYKLPFSLEDRYGVYIQKQPGKGAIDYTVSVVRAGQEEGQQSLSLSKDATISF